MPTAETAPEQPTVFVVDDDPGIRDSVTWLFQSVGLPVETYGSAQTFLDTYVPSRPGCLILDVRLPGMGGLDLLEALRRRGATLPVIVVTAFGEVHSTVRAMKGGAIDVMEKPTRDQVLLDRVHQALEKDRRTRASLASRADAVARYARLSKREVEVLKLIIAGKANKEIAGELERSTKTVEAHRAAIMRKLGARSIAEVVRIVLLAEESGNPLIPPG
jgi:two-component system, LuxR family, response regulator FixJ